MTDEEIKIMCDRMGANYLEYEKTKLDTYYISAEEKVQILSNWADKYKEISVFLETGTRRGETLFAMKDKFRKLYSVELSERWYNKSMTRHAKAGSPENIIIENGNCLLFIPKVLKETNDRCLIWLDAHGKRGTPILEELDIIFNDKIKDHVILIDDAYDFSRGHLNYPSIYQIRDLALENGYNFTMENERTPEVMILYPQ